MMGVIVLIMISGLFYRSWIAFVCFLPSLIFYRNYRLKEYRKNMLDQLNMQFCDGLQALNSALHAGYSVERGFREALKDLKLLYGDGALIVQEFRYICYGMEMNEVPEQLLYSLAQRCGLEDVCNFAEIFHTAKRTGGDLNMVILATTSAIRDKTEVDREIQQMLASVRFQQKIMNVVPCAILGYVNLTSPDFLSPIYGEWYGVLIMSGCLAMYGIGVLWGKRMLAGTG